MQRCPVMLVPDWTVGWIRAWEQYTEHGTLPGAGGLQDQPAMWIDAMEQITQSVAECRAENTAESERFADLPRVERRR